MVKYLLVFKLIFSEQVDDLFIVELDIGDCHCYHGIVPALLDLIEDFSNYSWDYAHTTLF